MTAVATVTPGIETQTREKDIYVMMSTTTVTKYTFGASSAAASTANAKREAPQEVPTPRRKRSAPLGTHKTPRQLEARAVCASPSTTATITQGVTTTTVYITHTLHRNARATTTAPACQADDNYGLINGTLNRRYWYGSGQAAEVSTFENATKEECCRKCFESKDGCVAWSFGGSVSNTEPVGGCSMATYEGGCPSFSKTETIVYQNDEKPLVGLGACNVKVSYFSG